MPATLEKTVREIALENPASIRVFESMGIDYCCGGKRPLTEACSHANVDFASVVALLESIRKPATPGTEWKNRSLTDLIAHIVGTHHAYVRRETPRIDTLLAKVLARHGTNHPEISQIQVLFSAISHELATHMIKEEHILFPHLERLEQASQSGKPVPSACFSTVQLPIAAMMAEHDDAGALLAQIRQLSNGYTAPAGACPTYLGLYLALEEFEHDLHHHVHLENNSLFPRAVEMEQAS